MKLSASRGIDRFTEHGLIVNGKEICCDTVIFATGYKEYQLDVTIKVDESTVYADNLITTWPKWYKCMLYDVPNLFVHNLDAAVQNVPPLATEQAMSMIIELLGYCRRHEIASLRVKDQSEYYRSLPDSYKDTHSFLSPACKSTRYSARVFGTAPKVFTFENHARRKLTFDSREYEFTATGATSKIKARLETLFDFAFR